jgi:PAS domain-containing protein
MKTMTKCELRIAKWLLAILILHSPFAIRHSSAATYYKYRLEITNLPVVSATLDAGGDTRRWTNNTPAVAGKFLQTTNTLQAATTNLYNHLLTYGFTNINAVKAGTNGNWIPTNTIVLETTADAFVTLTSLSNWVSITISTASPPTGWIVTRYPVSNEVVSLQTQIVSAVVHVLNSPQATNSVNATSPLFDNFIAADSQAQSTTNKTSVNGTNNAGLSTNQFLARARVYNDSSGGFSALRGIWFLKWSTNTLPDAILGVNDSGRVVLVNSNGTAITNYSAPEAEDLMNYYQLRNIFPVFAETFVGQTNLFQIENWFTNALNRWVNGMISNANLLASAHIAGSFRGEIGVSNGVVLLLHPTNTFTIGENGASENWSFTDAGTQAKHEETVLRIGDFNAEQFDWSAGDSYLFMVIKNGAWLTNTELWGATNKSTIYHGDYANVGTFRGTNVIVSNVTAAVSLNATNVGLSNVVASGVRTLFLRMDGSNFLSGRLATGTSTNYTLVNGNNAGILTGTNAVLDLRGATTIAQIAGFVATGDGDELEVRFSGAVTNWIINHTGSSFSTDGTAANRIRTGTGGDITQTNQPAWAKFRYHGADALWDLKSYSR